MTREELLALAFRVANGRGDDNALDVEIEIALFTPDRDCKAIRANAAGTKIIVTTASGKEKTHWASDWTMSRLSTAATLRARAAQIGGAS